jgi:hypothetical protein
VICAFTKTELPKKNNNSKKFLFIIVMIIDFIQPTLLHNRFRLPGRNNDVEHRWKGGQIARFAVDKKVDN